MPFGMTAPFAILQCVDQWQEPAHPVAGTRPLAQVLLKITFSVVGPLSAHAIGAWTTTVDRSNQDEQILAGRDNTRDADTGSISHQDCIGCGTGLHRVDSVPDCDRSRPSRTSPDDGPLLRPKVAARVRSFFQGEPPSFESTLSWHEHWNYLRRVGTDASFRNILQSDIRAPGLYRLVRQVSRKKPARPEGREYSPARRSRISEDFRSGRTHPTGW